MRRLALPLTLVFSAVAAFLAMVPWADLFLTSVGGGPPLPVLAAGVVVALIVSVVTISVARWRFAASVGASVGAFILFSLLAIVEPRFAVGGFLDGYTGAVDRVLTSVPPLLVTGGVLVPLMTLGWLVVGSNTELILRTRAVGVLLIGPAALLLVAQLVATRPSVADPGLATQLWLPLAVLACLALMVVFRHQSLDVERIGEPSAPERRAMLLTPVVGGLLVLFTVAVAVGVTDLVPGSDDEASLERRPPVEVPSSSGPVETFAALRNPSTEFAKPYHPCSDLPEGARRDCEGQAATCRTADDCTLLRVEGLPGGQQYVALLALTDYDGSTWQLPEESVFVPVGLRIPGDDPPNRAAVDQTYTVVRPLPADQPWLAAVPQPTEVLDIDVSGVQPGEVLVDPGAGALRSPVPLEAGASYSVRSAQSSQALAGLTPGGPVFGSLSPPLEAARRRLPTAVGVVVDGWLQKLGRDPQNAFANLGSLQELAQTLASRGFDPATGPEQVPGSRSLSLAGLDATFPVGDGSIALPTPAQVASHFALLVRSQGIPSRVVTGFRIESTVDSTVQLRATDQWTWAEVFVGDVGWVVVDPLGDDRPPPPLEQPPQGSETDDEPTDTIVPPPGSLPPPLPPPDPEPISRLGVIVTVVVGLLFAGTLAVVLGYRRRRWARRRRGEPVERVLGAWRELLDRLDESRTGPLRAATSAEVVAAVRDRHGEEVAQPVGNVATLADPAVFSARPMSSEEADAAWRNLEAARRALASRQTLGQRLVAFLRAYRPQRFRRN